MWLHSSLNLEKCAVLNPLWIMISFRQWQRHTINVCWECHHCRECVNCKCLIHIYFNTIQYNTIHTPSSPIKCWYTPYHTILALHVWNILWLQESPHGFCFAQLWCMEAQFKCAITPGRQSIYQQVNHWNQMQIFSDQNSCREVGTHRILTR